MNDALDGQRVIDAPGSGLSGRVLLSGVGLMAEGMGVVKLAGREALSVADAMAFGSLDAIDGLCGDFAGPLANLVKVPLGVLRATYELGSAGTRQLVDVA